MRPDSIHLFSRSPKIGRWYAVISAATCAALPVLDMFLIFHVPNSVVAFEIRRGVGIAASFRLPQRRVILIPEGAISPQKTVVFLCVFPRDCQSKITCFKCSGRQNVSLYEIESRERPPTMEIPQVTSLVLCKQTLFAWVHKTQFCCKTTSLNQKWKCKHLDWNKSESDL